MAAAELSLEQAPPISVPLRFILTAPLFALLAALLLAFAGPSAFASRWTPATLAATHLITLGFLGMCMVGALTQMLPVLAGAIIRAPRRMAWLTHAPLSAGVLLLGSGFLFGSRAALLAALPLLGWALLGFASIAGTALWRSPARNATVLAMKLALLALSVTTLLGVLLALGLSGIVTLALPRLTDAHASWGTLGWIGLLVVGVAYQVVPMFQLTRPYPEAMRQLLAPLLLAALLVGSFAYWHSGGSWYWAGVATVLAGFAAVTLNLQRQRRRRVPDVTLRFWRLGMLSMLCAILLWCVAQFAGWSSDPSYSLALGSLWLVGFAMSAINGMLYKIVPFLVWLHLQSQARPRGSVPNMKEVIGDTAARRHAAAHEIALALLLCATVWPMAFFYPAIALNSLSAALLGWNLLSALLIYRRHI